ncbi:MAG: SelT/SelW/SelH family protein [Gemmatimonadetes bacterium]|nr:SelT/SelW/SelH family protein [Gemmatimonadota bacterium]
MAAEIKAEYADANVKLIHSSGGAFEVMVDGELVFSKLSLGRHAQPGEVLDLIHRRRAKTG